MYTAEYMKNISNISNKNRNIVNNLSENPITYADDGFVITDITISGTKFNEIYRGVPLVKLTNEECLHNGFQYMAGLNIDTNFKYDKSCGPDGLYFCRLDDMHKWLNYSSMPMMYVWDVVIPNDAKTIVYKDKLKSDRFILSNKRLIADHIVDYIMNKLDTMSKTSELDDIFKFMDAVPSKMKEQMEENIEQIYLKMLDRFPEAITRIPTDYRTYDVCLKAAKLYDDAYDHIRDYCLSHEIMIECMKRDPKIYLTLTDFESFKSVEMSEIAFNYDTMYYENIPLAHKTKEMTIKYLTQYGGSASEDIISHIPKEFINDSDIIDTVLAKNGMYLNKIDYREKTTERCMTAVSNDGNALQYVPFQTVTQEMCDVAIAKNATATVYAFVPEKFRTMSMKEFLVESDIYFVNTLDLDEITHKMMLQIIKKRQFNFLQYLDYTNSNISNMFHTHMTEYIDVWNTYNTPFYKIVKIARYVSHQMFKHEHILQLISHDKSNFELFKSKITDFEFVVECVKRGVNVNAIKSHLITQQLLVDLVSARKSIIDELPIRFVNDELYIIAVTKHNMPISDVPEQYRTSRFCQAALNIDNNSVSIAPNTTNTINAINIEDVIG